MAEKSARAVMGVDARAVGERAWAPVGWRLKPRRGASLAFGREACRRRLSESSPGVLPVVARADVRLGAIWRPRRRPSWRDALRRGFSRQLLDMARLPRCRY